MLRGAAMLCIASGVNTPSLSVSWNDTDSPTISLTGRSSDSTK